MRTARWTVVAALVLASGLAAGCSGRVVRFEGPGEADVFLKHPSLFKEATLVGRTKPGPDGKCVLEYELPEELYNASVRAVLQTPTGGYGYVIYTDRDVVVTYPPHYSKAKAPGVRALPPEAEKPAPEAAKPSATLDSPVPGAAPPKQDDGPPPLDESRAPDDTDGAAAKPAPSGGATTEDDPLGGDAGTKDAPAPKVSVSEE